MKKETIQEQYDGLLKYANKKVQKSYIKSCCDNLIEKCKEVESKLNPFKEIESVLKRKKSFDEKNVCIKILKEYLDPGKTFLEKEMKNITNAVNTYVKENKNNKLEELSGRHSNSDFKKFIQKYSNSKYLSTLKKLVATCE